MLVLDASVNFLTAHRFLMSDDVFEFEYRTSDNMSNDEGIALIDNENFMSWVRAEDIQLMLTRMTIS